MDLGKEKTKGWPRTANLHSNVNYCNGIQVCRLPYALGYLVENRHHHNILIPSMMLRVDRKYTITVAQFVPMVLGCLSLRDSTSTTSAITYPSSVSKN